MMPENTSRIKKSYSFAHVYLYVLYDISFSSYIFVLYKGKIVLFSARYVSITILWTNENEDEKEKNVIMNWKDYKVLIPTI